MNALSIIGPSFRVEDAGLEWTREGLGNFRPGEIVHASGTINGVWIWLEINSIDNMCRVAFGRSPKYPSERVSPEIALKRIRQQTGDVDAEYDE